MPAAVLLTPTWTQSSGQTPRRPPRSQCRRRWDHGLSSSIYLREKPKTHLFVVVVVVPCKTFTAGNYSDLRSGTADWTFCSPWCWSWSDPQSGWRTSLRTGTLMQHAVLPVEMIDWQLRVTALLSIHSSVCHIKYRCMFGKKTLTLCKKKCNAAEIDSCWDSHAQ